MNKPIFILGLTKSGTSLLRNLFDGHSQLFTIPSESHFFQNINFWVSYYFRRTKPQNLSYDEMKENLIDWIQLLNQTHQRVTDAFTKGKWDVDIVKQVLRSEQTTDLKQLSNLYMRAMYKGLTGKEYNPSLEFVEKSVENAEFAFEWKELYPDARFIHVLRNPYANLVALRKYAQYDPEWKNKYPYLKMALYSMHNSFYFLYKNMRMIKNYKIVRYEDLLKKPNETMQELSDWLHIPFEKTLLNPSVLGENWAGNSTSGEQFKGISATNVKKWRNEINKLEIYSINKFFDFILKDFNYEQIEPYQSILFPVKKEKPLTFIQNRLLMRYMPKF